MNLNINAGGIKLTINNDPNRVLEFNPEDVGFAARFYDLMQEFKAKAQEYSDEAQKLDNNKELDEYGIPVNMKEKIELLSKVCAYFREQIDRVFGLGTSAIVFGKINNVNMFAEFFEGITPYIDKARTEKIKKYTGKKTL